MGPVKWLARNTPTWVLLPEVPGTLEAHGSRLSTAKAKITWKDLSENGLKPSSDLPLWPSIGLFHSSLQKTNGYGSWRNRHLGRETRSAREKPTKCDFGHDKSHMGCPSTALSLGLSAALPAVSIQAVGVWRWSTGQLYFYPSGFSNLCFGSGKVLEQPMQCNSMLHGAHERSMVSLSL
jgi:hypothetical protein